MLNFSYIWTELRHLLKVCGLQLELRFVIKLRLEPHGPGLKLGLRTSGLDSISVKN